MRDRDWISDVCSAERVGTDAQMRPADGAIYHTALAVEPHQRLKRAAIDREEPRGLRHDQRAHAVATGADNALERQQRPPEGEHRIPAEPERQRIGILVLAVDPR